MNRDEAMRTAGLAAVIMLAPGGFLLGAALLARRLRQRHAARPAPPQP
jgi:hypothetical protein